MYTNRSLTITSNEVANILRYMCVLEKHSHTNLILQTYNGRKHCRGEKVNIVLRLPVKISILTRFLDSQ